MRLHENWELFSDALQAASQPANFKRIIQKKERK